MEREDYQEDCNELLYRLFEHFNNCYDKYMTEILEMDKVQIAEAASEIVAVKEIYVEMCFWLVLSMCKNVWPTCLVEVPMNEQDAVDLLELDNPLKMLAMKWWFYSLGSKADFYDFYKAERKCRTEQL